LLKESSSWLNLIVSLFDSTISSIIFAVFSRNTLTIAFPAILKGKRQASSEGLKLDLINPQVLDGDPLPFTVVSVGL